MSKGETGQGEDDKRPPAATPDPAEATLALGEEVVRIDQRRVVTGRVRIATQSEEVEEIVHADLTHERVEVERVPLGRVVDRIPDIRVEGDVTILPVVEEVVVLERRLVLVEEVRITRRRDTETRRLPVTLRKDRLHILRLPAEGTSDPETEPETKGGDNHD